MISININWLYEFGVMRIHSYILFRHVISCLITASFAIIFAMITDDFTIRNYAL